MSFAQASAAQRRDVSCRDPLGETLTQPLGIVDHLRRRSATADLSYSEFAHFKSAIGRTRCFKLGAHFLGLRCLLPETCGESFDFVLLLRVGRFLPLTVLQ
jgi:hypothetical protein